MKNNKLYIVIAFLIGLVLAQYFSKKEPTVVVVQSQAPQASQINLDSKKAGFKKLELKQLTEKTNNTVKNKISTSEVLTLTEVLEKHRENQAKEFQAKTKRQVELVLTDDGLLKLERNLNTLTSEVSMAKEDRGWRVNYQSENNPMASLGIMNNDLILYDLINSARQNPQTEKLISRLENIFETLQR